MPAASLSRRAEWLAAVLLSAAFAGFFWILGDLKPFKLAVVVAGIIGLSILAILPNRRIVLVGVFIFLHPLSIQKAFQMSGPQHPGFFPPFYSIAASDVALFLLLLDMSWEALTRDSRPFYWPAAATPLALLAAWATLEFLLIQPTMEGVTQVAHWIKLLLAIVVFASAIRTREELQLVLLAIALMLAFQCIVVAATFLLHKQFFFGQGLDPDNPMREMSTGAVRVLLAAQFLLENCFHRRCGLQRCGHCCYLLPGRLVDLDAPRHDLTFPRPPPGPHDATFVGLGWHRCARRHRGDRSAGQTDHHAVWRRRRRRLVIPHAHDSHSRRLYLAISAHRGRAGKLRGAPIGERLGGPVAQSFQTTQKLDDTALCGRD
jgi:hypothetical protein